MRVRVGGVFTTEGYGTSAYDAKLDAARRGLLAYQEQFNATWNDAFEGIPLSIDGKLA